MVGVVVGVALACLVGGLGMFAVVVVLRETNDHHVKMAVEQRKSLRVVVDGQLAAAQMIGGGEVQPEPRALPPVRWKHEPRQVESTRLDGIPHNVLMPGDPGHDRVREAGW